MRKCVACQQRLRAVLGSSPNTDDQVVRCMSCGAYAHRTCAMKPELWQKCPVNSTLLENEGVSSAQEEDGGDGGNTDGATVEQAQDDEKEEASRSLFQFLSPPAQEQQETDITNDLPVDDSNVAAQQDDSSEKTEASRSLFQFLSPSNLLTTAPPQEVPKELSTLSCDDDDNDDEEIMLWTPDGPPQHWANQDSVSGIRRTDSSDDKEEEEPNTPLHVANNTFATVSRALQENIIAHFIRRPFIEREALSQDQSETTTSDVVKEQDQKAPEPPKIEKTDSTDSHNVVDVKALLTEVPPSSPSKSKIARMASGTMEAAKTSAAMRTKLGLASVAGGIAGGVAGLVVAGPAGAVIGIKAGQTAGLLGVILEGSMTVGVFVAGVAAGGFTAHHIQQQQEKRVLTIGEDGIKNKLLLIRPNVWIDPEWEPICAKARSTHASSNRRTFGILSEGKQTAQERKQRQRRDSDIVETDESEIATSDKVLLLVSRSLNDKHSLPGHVYKCLIKDYRERCAEREKAKQEQVDDGDYGDDDHDDESMAIDTVDETLNEPLLDEKSDNITENEEDTETRPEADPLRARRHDTHAVIKHVTATLLEVRPGFAASPVVTEMSATAVECLVFGELYDSVFEEIVEETKASDQALMDKILEYEASIEENNESSSSDGNLVSQPALDALLMLPEAHSAVDKLRYCVEFLELISVHFSVISKGGKGTALCADSLLKMVCQHIIAARVPNINAEIVFMEEFARDEQLLRGKEGYALVTLQASLHFLNASTNFDKDIFSQDDEEA